MLAFATIYKGDDVNQTVLILKNGIPVDLSSAQEISITMDNDPSQAQATQQWTKTNSKITLNGSVQGGINLVPAAADTAILKAKQQADLDVVVTDAAGKMQTYRVSKGITVADRET